VDVRGGTDSFEMMAERGLLVLRQVQEAFSSRLRYSYGEVIDDPVSKSENSM
jgi:hypothetical protein